MIEPVRNSVLVPLLCLDVVHSCIPTQNLLEDTNKNGLVKSDAINNNDTLSSVWSAAIKAAL